MYVEALNETKNTTADSGVRYAYKANRGNAFEYDTLVNKPNMQITVIDDSGTYDVSASGRRRIVENAVSSAKKIGWENENGNAVVHVEDADADVILSKAGIRHGFDRRFTVSAPVALHYGEILKNSVKINELTPENENISESYVLIGAAKNQNNEPYIVQFVVDRATNEIQTVDVLHAANTKKEPAALLPEITGNPATLTDSSISIANLLDYVNKYFPDILPESGKSI